MGTVANSNYGFKGTVSSAETPQVLGNGSLYSVGGKADLKVTAGGTGDRAVSIAAGTAWGDAVLSKWTTGDNTRTCAANSTGSTRYDTVVIRRTWTPAGTPTGTATLMVLTGGSSVAVAAGRLTDRGVTSSDQPIALVPVPNGSAVVGTPIDLRCWTGEGGGLVAEHIAALQYLGSKGAQVQIGPITYTRLEDGTGTLYWAQDPLVLSGTAVGVPAGPVMPFTVGPFPFPVCVLAQNADPIARPGLVIQAVDGGTDIPANTIRTVYAHMSAFGSSGNVRINWIAARSA